MPHDPELLAETRSWFQKALRDLEAGEFELTAPSPFTEAPPREEAHAVLALAREVYDTVLARLPEQVRP